MRTREAGKMGRTPCCENMGVRKGPWTPEEDQILISHIKRYGHGNWRAIPRQAGLFRCGKSCRLRWSNYLKPGVKRGNFTKEEEDAIISLHAVLGSRWSAIAANLPGRTDNEIKNFWHGHLKKRFDPNQQQQKEKKKKHDEHDHVLPDACSRRSDAAAGVSSSHPEISGEEMEGNHEVIFCFGEEGSRAEAFDPVMIINGERQSFWSRMLAEAANLND